MRFTVSSAFPWARASTMSPIQLPIFSNSFAPKPLVVPAGVPTLIPEVIFGGWGS